MTSKQTFAAYAAAGAGFTGEPLVTIVAIGGAESSWNPDARPVDNPKGWKGPDCHSYGTWQINVCPGRDDNNPNRGAIADDLNDNLVNARAAFAISSGGTNFNPWSTFRPDPKTGAAPKYLGFVQQARDAVAALEPGYVERYRKAQYDPGLPSDAGIVETIGQVIAHPPSPGELLDAGKAAAEMLNPLKWTEAIAAFLSLLTRWSTWRRVIYLTAGLLLLFAAAQMIRADITLAQLSGGTPDEQ